MSRLLESGVYFTSTSTKQILKMRSIEGDKIEFVSRRLIQSAHKSFIV